MSVLISNEKFVKLGVLIPNPSPETISTLCAYSKDSDMAHIANFQNSIFTKAPQFIEYLYVSGSSGIGMYATAGIILYIFISSKINFNCNLGFDVMLHYSIVNEQL